MIKIKDKPQTANVLRATGIRETIKDWARGKIKMIKKIANNKYKKSVITIGAMVKWRNFLWENNSRKLCGNNKNKSLILAFKILKSKIK